MLAYISLNHASIPKRCSSLESRVGLNDFFEAHLNNELNLFKFWGNHLSHELNRSKTEKASWCDSNKAVPYPSLPACPVLPRTIPLPLFRQIP